MYVQQPKKLLIMNILEILKKYTDEDHRLNQREIGDILKNEYQMPTDRKAIKNNLMNLIDFGYNIEYSENNRTSKKGKEEVMCSDWYLVRDFTDAELRILIDSVLFSKHIPHKQCKDLIAKIEGLSSKYFKAKVKHVYNLPENIPQNKNLFYIIEILDEAIQKGKQVQFKYNKYDIDKKMHPRENSDGTIREYIVNPYQMVATNGKYYLICNYDEHDYIANYRIDRITDIELLDAPVKPVQKLKDAKYGLDLPKHMAEHIYMFTGPSEQVSFRAKRLIVSELFDWFGTDMVFSDATDDEVTVTVKVNLQAMHLWAIQYCRFIKVLSPQNLASTVQDDLKQAIKNYGG